MMRSVSGYMEDENTNQFRHVHPIAKEVKGRPIPHILYERSIFGPYSARGRRQLIQVPNQQPIQQHEEQERLKDENANHDVTTSDLTSPHTVAIPGPFEKISSTNDSHSAVTTNDDVDDGTNVEHPPCYNNNKNVSHHHHELIQEISLFAEFSSVTRYHWSYFNLIPEDERRMSTSNHSHLQFFERQRRLNNTSPGSASISTISIAFSPDGRTFASTHGDHTVKITCCNTGRLIRTLEGHPRTPWTVKYHPIKSNIVASGCLGFQVRVWNWNMKKRTRPTTTTNNNNNTTQDDPYSYHDGEGVLLNMIRLQYAIISLSFHTSGWILAVASGQTLHLWDYCDYAGRKRDHQQSSNNNNNNNDNHAQNSQTQMSNSIGLVQNSSSSSTAQISTIHNNDTHNNTNQYEQQQNSSTNTNTTNNNQQNYNQQQQQQQRNRAIIGEWSRNEFYESRSVPTRQGNVTEIRYEHALRCVHFPPNGTSIIIGGVNPSDPTLIHNAHQRGGMAGGGMSFSLCLWDFDLEAALYPHLYLNQNEDANNNNINMNDNEGSQMRIRREAISNSRVFVPRALLYNDGGFDVSPDGKTLCACAEYWLPDGVDSVMDLIQEEEEQNRNTDNTNAHGNVNESNGEDAVMTEMDESSFEDMQAGNPSTDNDKTITESRRRTEYASTERQNMENNLDSDHIPSPPRNNAAPVAHVPRTPPNPPRPQMPLSPPSPPGRRFHGGLGSRRQGQRPDNSELVRIANQPLSSVPNDNSNGSLSRTEIIMARMMMNQMIHQPHPLCLVGNLSKYRYTAPQGRYVPHVVTVNLDSTSVKTRTNSHHPHLGQLLQASPLDSTKASGVTCVKFSPSTEYCLLGYGVRETIQGEQEIDSRYHPVAAVYRINGMKHISTMLSGDDDVNIARFHPQSGHGFVYGTKQGRVRNMSTRPWNYYHDD